MTSVPGHPRRTQAPGRLEHASIAAASEEADEDNGDQVTLPDVVWGWTDGRPPRPSNASDNSTHWSSESSDHGNAAVLLPVVASPRDADAVPLQGKTSKRSVVESLLQGLKGVAPSAVVFGGVGGPPFQGHTPPRPTTDPSSAHGRHPNQPRLPSQGIDHRGPLSDTMLAVGLSESSPPPLKRSPPRPSRMSLAPLPPHEQPPSDNEGVSPPKPTAASSLSSSPTTASPKWRLRRPHSISHTVSRDVGGPLIGPPRHTLDGSRGEPITSSHVCNASPLSRDPVAMRSDEGAEVKGPDTGTADDQPTPLIGAQHVRTLPALPVAPTVSARSSMSAATSPPTVKHHTHSSRQTVACTTVCDTSGDVGQPKTQDARNAPAQLTCAACGTAIDAPMDKVEIDNHRAVHRACFRCERCHERLTPATFHIIAPSATLSPTAPCDASLLHPPEVSFVCTTHYIERLQR